MRSVPERAAGIQILSVFGGFLLGPLASIRVSTLVAPGSALIETVGVLASILVFVGGTVLWMGFGVAAVILRALGSLVRGRLPTSATSADRDRLVPPGYRAYVVLGPFLGVAVGVLTALVTELGLLVAIGAWGGLGIAYGVCLYLAAHHGYLPFPEPE